MIVILRVTLGRGKLGWASKQERSSLLCEGVNLMAQPHYIDQDSAKERKYARTKDNDEVSLFDVRLALEIARALKTNLLDSRELIHLLGVQC